MNKLRQIIMVLLLTILVLFVVSNLQSVTIQLLSLKIEAPLAVVMILCAALGALCALLTGVIRRSRARRKGAQDVSP